MNWEALLYLLGRVGFGDRWRQWNIPVFFPQYNSWFLINESPTGFFKSTSRDSRQRHPLSPMLFLLMMVAFRRMIRRMEGLASLEVLGTMV